MPVSKKVKAHKEDTENQSAITSKENGAPTDLTIDSDDLIDLKNEE
jgi:hypothetical protein